VLSLLTKVASGYYQVADSQSGYTAIRVSMLRRIDLDAMYPRYGYPNDMLVRLNVERARVVDVASVPVYDVGEVSGLKIRRVLFTMSWLLLKRFVWRLWKLYVVRDFHPLVMFYVLGMLALVTGTISSLALIIYSLGPETVSGSTAVGASILLQSGLLLTLFGMLFDFEHNRPLVSESRPVHLDADRVTHAPIRASIEQAPVDPDGGHRPPTATSIEQELTRERGTGRASSTEREAATERDADLGDDPEPAPSAYRQPELSGARYEGVSDPRD
jgi:hypothetical protein